MTDDQPTVPVPPDEVVPLGGRIRVAPEDFLVEELPLYEPTGAGEHLMILVEKRGLTTPMMISKLGSRLGVRPRDVGWAGYKDRHAVTRQWVTVPARPPEEVLALEFPGVRILEARLHQNKLRTGHLRGNRFTIAIRGVDTELVPRARETFERLVARGMPNGLGPQRFGVRGDNYHLGRALLDGDAERFLELVGDPVPERESPRVVAAREALRAGRFKEAVAAFPSDFLLERHLCLALQKQKGDAAHAVKTLPGRSKSLLVTAWQSYCFNSVLARRLATFDRLLAGDVAMKHPTGSCFLVEDEEREAVRAASGEISPTGPLPGPKMLRPVGAAGEIEQEVLSACGTCEDFNTTFVPRKACQGARRSLRARVTDGGFETPEDGVVLLRFALPKGSFATSLLAFFGI